MEAPIAAALPPGSWAQVYEPHGLPWWVSGLIAALPIAVLFWLLGIRRTSAPRAAFAGAGVAVLVAILFVGMPPAKALAAFAYGAAVGLFPIGWIVFAALLVYQVAVDGGGFEVMKASIGRITADRRIQAILIGFSFNAILEGAAGFGTPVAISAALLVGLGFKPFPAAVICLIGNTVPVAWASIGIPVKALAMVSGLPVEDLSAAIARILPPVAMLIPLWLVRTMVSWRETVEVLPACLVGGVSFAAAQLFWGNFVDVGLVGIVPGLVSLLALAGLLLVWRPRREWRFPGEPRSGEGATEAGPEIQDAPGAGRTLRAWLPFILLLAFVVAGGMMRSRIDGLALGPIRARISIPVPALHGEVLRTSPVVRADQALDAEYDLGWLSAPGTAAFLAALAASILLGRGPRGFGRSFLVNCRRMRTPILALMPMLGLGYVTRYAGLDAILGLAFTHTGVLYPFFGTFLGWIGVAITGSDTASNTLFGSLQRITAERLGLDATLLCAANAAGGCVGKMVNAGSIVVASAATGQVGQEGKILGAVFRHALAMGVLVALIVLAYAYLFPGLVPRGVGLIGS